MTGAAHCQRCDWTTTGTPPDADKAAEAHTRKTGHPIATITRHADHDPALTCRPALGHGLCEPLPRNTAT